MIRRALCRRLGGAAQAPYDWTTDGGDNQRTGWNKNEKILTKDNIRNLKLLWKIETGNQVRALHALMPVLVIGRLNTPAGPKQIGYRHGYLGQHLRVRHRERRHLWQKHWDYVLPQRAAAAPEAAGRRPRARPRSAESSARSVPAAWRQQRRAGHWPAGRQGRRPVYFVTGDGMHAHAERRDRRDLEPPLTFHTGKGWSLNLLNDTIFMANTYAGASIVARSAGRSQHKVVGWSSVSGGAWGRRGASVDSPERCSRRPVTASTIQRSPGSTRTASSA